MNARIAIRLALVCAALPACATMPRQRPELGAPVKLTLAAGPVIEGELLVVSAESAWVRVDTGIQGVSLGAVTRARLDRQRYGGGQGAKRGVLFGLGTGVALAAACGSVEGSSNCLDAALVSILLSTLVSVIAVPSMDQLRFLVIDRPAVPQLAPWARYPQGWPPSFSRRSTSRPDPPSTP